MKSFLSLCRAVSFLFAVVTLSGGFAAQAARKGDIDMSSTKALEKLYQKSALARSLSAEASAILIFPNMVKGGIAFGGAYG